MTAVIELGAGLALLCCPSAAVALVLGSPLDPPAAAPLGRLAGAALLALGVACWLVWHHAPGCAASGVVTALTLYNLGAVGVLGAAGLGSPPVGVALWPAVVLHALLTIWCLASLLRKPSRDSCLPQPK